MDDPLVTRKAEASCRAGGAMELARPIARAFGSSSSHWPRALRCRQLQAHVHPRRRDVGQIAGFPRLATAITSRSCPWLTCESSHRRTRSLGDLTSSEIDLHLGITGRSPGLHVEPLLEEPSLLVARHGHAGGRPKALAGPPWPSCGTCASTWFPGEISATLRRDLWLAPTPARRRDDGALVQRRRRSRRRERPRPPCCRLRCSPPTRVSRPPVPS